jgi:hypothetical protein
MLRQTFGASARHSYLQRQSLEFVSSSWKVWQIYCRLHEQQAKTFNDTLTLLCLHLRMLSTLRPWVFHCTSIPIFMLSFTFSWWMYFWISYVSAVPFPFTCVIVFAYQSVLFHRFSKLLSALFHMSFLELKMESYMANVLLLILVFTL